MLYHDARQLLSGCSHDCRLLLHVKYSFKILSTPVGLSRKIQVCQGWPNRYNAPGVEREQRGEVASPGIVQLKAVADLRKHRNAGGPNLR